MVGNGPGGHGFFRFKLDVEPNLVVVSGIGGESLPVTPDELEVNFDFPQVASPCTTRLGRSSGTANCQRRRILTSSAGELPCAFS